MKTGLALAFSLVFVSAAACADVLFLNLNDADKEVAACRSTAGSDSVTVIDQASLNGASVNGTRVEKAITAAEAQGKCFDSIVISGHHGAGEFFGGVHEQNEFSSGDLQSILKRHPMTANCLRVAMLWGCYTGNLGANEEDWLQPTKSIQTTIAFPIQAPDKTVAANHRALRWACDKNHRRELASASSLAQICAMSENLQGILGGIGAAITNRCGIASRLYDDDWNKKGCYSNSDLRDRCHKFDPTDSLLEKFNCYSDATEPSCANPPPDGADIDAPGGKTDLRQMYDASHLYRHCTEYLNNNRGYKLPSPAQTIRLVKYNQIRENLSRLNASELQEYDARLADLGLERFQLGNIAGKSRAFVNRQVRGAIEELNKRSGQSRNGTSYDGVMTMAWGIKETLIDLYYKSKVSVEGDCAADNAPSRCYVRCSHFSLVHAGITDPNRKSQCIMSYQRAMEIQ